MFNIYDPLKIIERNAHYLQEQESLILLGDFTVSDALQVLNLCDKEQKLGIYTKYIYTYELLIKQLVAAKYQVHTNLAPTLTSKIRPTPHELLLGKLHCTIGKDVLPENLDLALNKKELSLVFGLDLELAALQLLQQDNNELCHQQTAQSSMATTEEQSYKFSSTQKPLNLLPIAWGNSYFTWGNNQVSLLAQQIVAQKAKSFLLFWPKSKEEFLQLLLEIKHAAEQANLQSEQVTVFFVGSNTSGIKSLTSLVTNHSNQLDNAARWRFCVLSGIPVPDEKLQNKSKFAPLQLPSGQTLATLPGVFSSDQLDVGTELLLSTYKDLQAPYNSHLARLIKTYNKDLNTENTNNQLHFLDYGVGSGAITYALQKWLEQQITNPQVEFIWHGIEVGVSALVAAAYNLQRLTQGTAKVSFNLQAASSIAQVQENGMELPIYREVISNPPFHQGKDQTFTITENLIKQARKRVHPQGALRIVANNGLPYLPLLQAEFSKVEIIAKANGFTVYLAKP